MPTRRQVLEAALVMERDALWSDLGEFLGDLLTVAAQDYVRRIRLISEALGYPTRHEALPLPLWRLYEFVETEPRLGIRAERIDWGLVEDHWDRCPPLTTDEKEWLSWKIAS